MTQSVSKPQQSWIGHTIGGRYEIKALLGHGGMSTVYQANDPNLRRTVAIKLIHPHLSNDPQFVRRFEQEAAAVAQLRHPNIIQVYDFNHDSGVYYMVLEYVPGETLQAKLMALNATGRRLSLVDTIQIMAPVCDAVAYAHQHGMIHRDLKPANVMLHPQGQPILMDFGVAKILGDMQHTATGAVIGTALYISPEQARGERPSERSDIYSLGVMLYEMITGVPPFTADSAISLMMKHVTQPVPDIRQINQNVPDLLVAVAKKALAKDPADRYQTASDMALTLRAIDVPESAAEETISPKARQRVESTKIESVSAVLPSAPGASKSGLPAWLIGLVVVVLVLGLGLGLFFLWPRSDQVASATEEAQTEEAQPVAESGDSALPSSEKMVKIGVGAYTVGREAPGQNYAPPQEVKLAEFWIDQYEVTNTQYAEFLADTQNPPPADWPAGNIPADQADHPVKGITWDMADAYCQWAKKRLPTEAEWEVAARGPEGRLFPWGDDPRAVELPRSGTYQVGGKPTNQSAFGVFDMAGNVWEWVGDTYAPMGKEGDRVLRGGENGFLKDMAYRLAGPPNQESIIKTAGIRCAADKVNLVQIDSIKVEGVLAQDGFADSGSGWPILSEGTYLFGYHPPDYYHVEVGLPNAHTVVSREANFDNVTVETKVLVDHTNTEQGNFRYGLALRRSAEDQYYAFTVSPRSGTWEVLKSTPTGLEVLTNGLVESLQGFAPPGFTPDKTDTLRVDANGSNFIFHINGQPVTQVSDADYANGAIGFFVETFDETLAHIHYDELTIRQVEFEPEAVPTPEATALSTTSISDAITATTSISSTVTPIPLTPTPEPASEIEPTATPEPPTPTLTPTPEGMVLIPAGEFLMGSSTGPANEAPEHPVSLDAFYIDLFEVTNAQYRECVGAGGCTPSNTANSFTYQGYRDEATYDNYPVIGVTWDQAETYCRWASKRLPTEAEWEYAASGPENLTWPWNNTFDPSLSAASAPDTQPVDSYPAGVSPFGVYNMAGNVAEWVQDVFDEGFYASSPTENPVNSGSSADRIYRGGAFGNPDGSFYTTSRRYSRPRTFSDVDIGFRCAKDVS